MLQAIKLLFKSKNKPFLAIPGTYNSKNFLSLGANRWRLGLTLSKLITKLWPPHFQNYCVGPELILPKGRR